MIVYHGCATWKAKNLLAGKSAQFMGLSVTDTFEHAMRYANAQATHEVKSEWSGLEECACVCELEVEAVKWSRRPQSHHTLDVCEAVVSDWKLISVTVHRPAYKNSSEHKNIDALKANVNVIEVEA